jgi:hypothetical protein
MARKTANTSAVEAIRKRLQRSMAQFSEDLGYPASAYAEWFWSNSIPFNVGLAAEALSRRQPPCAVDELIYLTRIVRGVPVITLLDHDVRTMILDGERYLLIPAEEPRSPRLGSGVLFEAAEGNNGVAPAGDEVPCAPLGRALA